MGLIFQTNETNLSAIATGFYTHLRFADWRE